ncbi:MAG: (2Fe-2S) ferredoxin domain-containing protein [Rhodospirillales bacterium]|jgi:(2Fe-2S) ferredoxin|nr:(2Fe-2S) ferredoxin domain-containing protein [Rhodospirillales bacterium]
MSDGSGDMRPFYDRHVFMCMNERPEGHERGSCASKGAVQLRNYMKARAKELGLDNTRINQAGCLDRCELGPTMVIYPEGIWYKCETAADCEEILTEHLQHGRPVKRLMLHPDDR